MSLLLLSDHSDHSDTAAERSSVKKPHSGSKTQICLSNFFSGWSIWAACLCTCRTASLCGPLRWSHPAGVGGLHRMLQPPQMKTAEQVSCPLDLCVCGPDSAEFLLKSHKQIWLIFTSGASAVTPGDQSGNCREGFHSVTEEKLH